MGLFLFSILTKTQGGGYNMHICIMGGLYMVHHRRIVHG